MRLAGYDTYDEADPGRFTPEWYHVTSPHGTRGHTWSCPRFECRGNELLLIKTGEVLTWQRAEQEIDDGREEYMWDYARLERLGLLDGRAHCQKCGHSAPLHLFCYLSAEEVLSRYPRLCAHIICESLGYATPLKAADILRDALMGWPNYCEWVASCFGGDPVVPCERAIRTRHYHKGYMAEYRHAILLVRRALKEGEPADMLASWF
jgi:hypothetical protein